MSTDPQHNYNWKETLAFGASAMRILLGIGGCGALWSFKMTITDNVTITDAGRPSIEHKAK
jgi:hypothetical protein